MIPEPILAGVAALGAATFAGIHAMAPRSQLYGETFFGAPGRGKKLALTYDDGPNEACTPQLLDILGRHQAKATFFLIGRFVKEKPELVRRIVRDGHAIGNHTYTHPNLIFCSTDEVKRELEDCARALAEIGCPLPESGPGRIMRPPFGGRRPATLRVVRALGYTPIMWSVTCWDWKQTTADKVEAHALRQIGAEGGHVILMHDGGYKQMGADRMHSVIATDRLLKKYKGEGFEFVTVPEMIAASRQLPASS